MGTWERDPSGRHELRWNDGQEWTEHVADGGRAATDPYEPRADATDGATLAPPVARSTPDGAAAAWAPASSSAAVGEQRTGVATGWVVTIAVVALLAGGGIGFMAGVATELDDVFADLGSGFSEGFDEGVGGALPADATTGEALEVGDEVDGVVRETGVAHPLQVDEATDLRLVISEAEFDTVIEVYDADDLLVAEDDDGGIAQLSRLDVSLDAGDYTVLVRPFGFGDGGGPYILRVERTAG